MTHDISPSSISFSFSRFLVFSSSAVLRREEEGVKSVEKREEQEISLKSYAAAGGVQTPTCRHRKSLQHPLKSIPAAWLARKSRRTSLFSAFLPTRSRTREFQSVILCLFLTSDSILTMIDTVFVARGSR